jgi:hypothetical protein
LDLGIKSVHDLIGGVTEQKTSTAMRRSSMGQTAASRAKTSVAAPKKSGALIELYD